MATRYGFKFEAYLHTYRNYFPSRSFSGAQLADLLVQEHAAGSIPPVPYGSQKISLAEAVRQNDELHLLFHLYDPLIPDPDYVDTVSGGIRTAVRRNGEEPARSAHLIMNVSSVYDATRAYPTGMENAEYLSRTLISRFLNDTLERITSSQETWYSSGGQASQKKLSQRIKFQAESSQTIDGILNNGGVLLGVKAVTSELRETEFGDAAYPVVDANDLSVKVLNRPTQDHAKGILSSIWQREKDKELKKFTVSIDDTVEGRLKTVNVDVSKGNILENVFIRQRSLGTLTPELRLCEPTIRSDLLDVMRRRLL